MVELLKIESTDLGYKITYSVDNGTPELTHVNPLIGRLMLAAQMNGRNEIRDRLQILMRIERRY